jgi:small-conductance mechanosensitive channel
MFSFIEENGMRLSVWYLTNAYATLTLRSTISASIIDAFKSEEDITIAYPTQTVRFIREKDLTIENSILEIHAHKKEQQKEQIRQNLENSLKEF